MTETRTAPAANARQSRRIIRIVVALALVLAISGVTVWFTVFRDGMTYIDVKRIVGVTDDGADPVFYDPTGRLLPPVRRMGERLADDLRTKDTSDLYELVGAPGRSSAAAVDALIAAYGGENVRLTSSDGDMPTLDYTVQCRGGSARDLVLSIEDERRVIIGDIATDRWVFVLAAPDGGQSYPRCPGR